MDALLEVLQSMRFTGGLFLDAEFTAPWCVTSRVEAADCRPFMPEPSHVIAYHYVTHGVLVLRLEGQASLEVRAGEIVVLPRNDSHLLGSAADLRPVDAGRLIKPGPDGGLASIRHGGGGEPTQILCGFLGSEFDHPVLSLLPPVLKLDVAASATSAWIESSFRFAASELATGRVGSPAVLAKLAELLFMEATRLHLAARPADSNGALAGLRDPVVGRALARMHGELARRWTIEELAAEVACSRSAFAERFSALMGEPPMRYLARWRMRFAAEQLESTRQSIAEIASRVGYDSEPAFHRAFKREFGLPPATWRRQQ
jgi:AraC-like DNA-binding protein